MVYLAELLVVMTAWLKIVRILARNLPRIRAQVLRRRHVSLDTGKRRCCVPDALGRCSFET